MKAKTLKSEKQSSSAWLAIAKGVVCGLCVSLVGILLFAFILRFSSISDKVIAPVNEVIKGVSIFFGVFVGLRKYKKMGLLNGILIGFLFTVVAFLVFSLLDGTFSFDRTLLNDIVFGSIIGAICGIICVNLKKYRMRG